MSRLVELALALIGLGFMLYIGDPRNLFGVLLLWDVLAVGYLTMGAMVCRRERNRTSAEVKATEPVWLRTLGERRLGFALTVIASLMGLSAALGVALFQGNATESVFVKVLGVVTMVCGWMLLHAGYARYYQALYYTVPEQEAGLDFPRESWPAAVEFLYFSFTLGTTFAVSDVNVTSRLFRWHVTVHSVIGFFYNAVILAFAISLLTGK
ncbi:DUF1345 domain-containing protein [Kitasatospora sp. NPDC098663]|uniref:DUF1345 domain-containing protein n=1 Tax=Kitasatospora sp. NPDC098663 TaxID=3364096 RepID=UPI003807988D